jgi:hypothetical protein
MLAKLNERYPPQQKVKNEDFSFDDPFANADIVDDYQPKVYRSGGVGVSPQRVNVTNARKGTNPLVIVLAIIGVITLIGCLVCVGTGVIGSLAIGQVVQEVVNDPTVQAAMNDPTVQAVFEEIGEEFGESRQTLGSVSMRGTIARGTTERAVVGDDTDDGWTFNGELGVSVTIEAVSPDGNLDPQLYLYDSNGQLIAENDDIEFGENQNSRIEIRLPSNGQYTIVVSSFGSGGDYELTLS